MYLEIGSLESRDYRSGYRVNRSEKWAENRALLIVFTQDNSTYWHPHPGPPPSLKAGDIGPEEKEM